MATLIEISNSLVELEAQLDELGFDEQSAVIEAWLEELHCEKSEEMQDKLDNYAALISDLLARTEVRKAEAQRLMQRAKVDQGKADNLKKMLQWFFTKHELKTVETDRYRITLAKNGGKAPIVLDEEYSVAAMPDEFVKISMSPDLEAIREALEAGEKLEFARLSDRGQSIRIR